MKISIDTVAKTVVIEYATINELQNIKGAIESVGGNPDEYSVTQLQSTVFYPTYPVINPFPYPNLPYYQVTCGITSINSPNEATTFLTGNCNIDSPLN